jgi:hypothetical protein
MPKSAVVENTAGIENKLFVQLPRRAAVRIHA